MGYPLGSRYLRYQLCARQLPPRSGFRPCGWNGHFPLRQAHQHEGKPHHEAHQAVSCAEAL